RWAVLPSEEFSPIARDVVIPHDVPVLIPSVSEYESLVPRDCEASALPDPVRAANGAAPVLVWPRPRLCPVVWLRDCDTDTDRAVPTVEVYEAPVVSVTEAPTWSVSWLSTKRCSEPICALAALASSALPRRITASAAFPRPTRCATGGEWGRYRTPGRPGGPAPARASGSIPSPGSGGAPATQIVCRHGRPGRARRSRCVRVTAT